MISVTRPVTVDVVLDDPLTGPMGLTLHYQLTLPGDTLVDDVRARLRALQDFAMTVGFEQVVGPVEYTLDDLVEPEPTRADATSAGSS